MQNHQEQAPTPTAEETLLSQCPTVPAAVIPRLFSAGSQPQTLEFSLLSTLAMSVLSLYAHPVGSSGHISRILELGYFGLCPGLPPCRMPLWGPFLPSRELNMESQRRCEAVATD